MPYVSNINRIQTVKHQVELDRGHRPSTIQRLPVVRPSVDVLSPRARVSAESEDAHEARRISRRRLLIGAGVVLIGGGLIAERELPLRRWYEDVTDASGFVRGV